MSIISIIAAISENRAIGKDNKLLWHIPEDMKRFRTLTRGHPIIMGRKTFESIGKPLPGRANIIVTRDSVYERQGCLVVHSLADAIKLAQKQEGNSEIFVIGGGEIYRQAMPMADKLYLTIVKGNFDADTYFPDYSRFSQEIARTEKQDENYRYSFLELSV